MRLPRSNDVVPDFFRFLNSRAVLLLRAISLLGIVPFFEFLKTDKFMFSEHLHWSSPISYDTEAIILPQSNILLTAGISKMFEAERFELADNDYIENHITEFYLDQNADIGDIAHAYLRSHPIPSISVIMLFDDFLYKKE